MAYVTDPALVEVAIIFLWDADNNPLHRYGARGKAWNIKRPRKAREKSCLTFQLREISTL